MIQQTFTCSFPETLSQAYQMRREMDNSMYLGGGTDLVPLMKSGVKKPAHLIGLEKLSELRVIEKRDGGLYVGAMASLWEILRSPLVKDAFPTLSQACRRVASPQIRTMGTLGGNLLQDRRCLYYNQSEAWRSSISRCYKTGGHVCHQAPASDWCRGLYYSDTAPVLWSLGAQASIFEDEEKWMPVEQLTKEHVHRNGGVATEERILKGFWIPCPPENSRMQFEKFSVRGSLVFSVMNLALQVWLVEEGIKGRIVVGGTSPVPVLLEETGKRLETSARFSRTDWQHTGELALKELKKKSRFIRESGLSLQVKRDTLQHVASVIEGLMKKEA